MSPMLGREVEEREQHLTILDQALDRRAVFGMVFLDEGVDRGFGFRPARRQIDVPQVVLHCAQHGFGDLVEHVADFVAPAPLVSRAGEDLVEGLPDPQSAVTDRQFRSDPQAALLHIDQELTPALGALAGAHLEADQFLAALRRRADQHQDTFAVILHPGLQINAIGPEIDVAPRRQVTSLPTLVLGLPVGRQACNHPRRQVRRVLAEQRRQRVLEVASRDAAQVEHRQQGIQAPGAPRPQRQDRRAEADPIGPGGAAVPNLRPGDLHGADAGLNWARRSIAVPDQPGPAVALRYTKGSVPRPVASPSPMGSNVTATLPIAG